MPNGSARPQQDERSRGRNAADGRAADSYATFSAFPAELSGHLSPHLDEIVGEVVEAIRTEIAEYARPEDGTYMHVVRTGARQALHDFLARMARPDADLEAVRATYRSIGRGEAEEGRSLEPFQAALRVGARVTWRRVNALVDAGRLPREILGAFGEALFLHLDEMAAATTTGYTEARLHAAGEMQRRRNRLIDLLTADPPAPAEAIGDLAHTARWPLPREIAVAVTEHTDQPKASRPILPPECLSRLDTRPGVVVVPDPEGPGRTRAIAGALSGTRTALGPTVPLTEGARSLRWATEALGLSRRGILPGTGLVRCADHLTTLLLFRDEELVDALADLRLRPLRRIRSPQRERLAETLLCWLRHGHNASEVATHLNVHPQTVRYRLRQLDEVFGDRLYDPAVRFDMQLALRVWSLRRAAGEEPPPE
ncbi:helix-turn-helix domain-containing protein [Streptomyces verrucosisporus]|uniref:PucR family transcriptional regulator n=1 Tax=Streptomyces verrucosisporus TaxID=1695161 RepID=UPI0019CF6B53|nr:helix-turn-helix domain-containing protein [Streptomyces verrucosisporus]MBN3929884.1 helix-turn-helix domain-containing protein [Streptomyces verrucosisporus]